MQVLADLTRVSSAANAPRLSMEYSVCLATAHVRPAAVRGNEQRARC